METIVFEKKSKTDVATLTNVFNLSKKGNPKLYRIKYLRVFIYSFFSQVKTSFTLTDLDSLNEIKQFSKQIEVLKDNGCRIRI